jgi:hypothetical protein
MNYMNKIGVLIPTRGDRPELLGYAMKQLARQSMKPDIIEVVNDAPLNGDKDITWRYRMGCERILAKGADVVFLIEDDDFYSAGYIETMMNQWAKAEQPGIFGIEETTYYHLGLRSFQYEVHKGRASAFSTMVTSEGIKEMKWPKDNYPFTDIELWKCIKGKTFVPARMLALGIKGHKAGQLFGGMGHNENRHYYKSNDENLNWLKSHVDEESFALYEKISNNVRRK